MVSDELTLNIEITIMLRNKVVADKLLIEALRLAEERGSLLAACRALGISYSRIWERVARAERILGMKLVETRRGGRGGGGIKLTPIAKKLIETYGRGLEVLRPCIEIMGRAPSIEKPIPELSIIGSHDPLLEKLIGIVRSCGVKDIEVHWVGSLGGLASLILGEADIAGIHLLDPSTNTYNAEYLKRFMLISKAILVKGYLREMGFALRPKLELNKMDEIIEMMRKGLLRIANRNPGSGTRVLLENILRRYGIDFSKVKGFETEYKTHFETISAVATGNADLCLAPYYLAKLYNLNFIHITWEHYDFVIMRSRLKKRAVQLFIETLKSEKEMINSLPGYKALNNTGEK
ncbi:MAG: MolR family transcriptional regulator [Thermoprotei archaeon]|nr:MAG: MolR family transcriptional regulator [Thermoprotei archaeon]